jgi:uncharacterized protein (DUF2249 family)
MADHRIDVRPIPPRDRHPQIFSLLDGLERGQALRLINDHDPAPLSYQIQATRPGQFDWRRVEDGPETWQVDIVRL